MPRTRGSGRAWKAGVECSSIVTFPAAPLGAGVFDILGQLFRDQKLKDLLIEAIRYGDRPDVKARLHQIVDNLTDRKHCQELLEERALAHDCQASEAEPFWTEFPRGLNRRGLRGVKLVISDSHEGPRPRLQSSKPASKPSFWTGRPG